jgi:hypothetical protein
MRLAQQAAGTGVFRTFALEMHGVDPSANVVMILFAQEFSTFICHGRACSGHPDKGRWTVPS